MEAYKIDWTTRATKDLRKAYNFYTGLIGEEKAFELILKILERADYLSDERFVKMGAIDEDFRHLKREYKKRIEGDIKITYRLSTTEPVVYIRCPKQRKSNELPRSRATRYQDRIKLYCALQAAGNRSGAQRS